MLDEDQPAKADDSTQVAEAPAKPVVKKTTRKAPAARAAAKKAVAAPAPEPAEAPAAGTTEAPAPPVVKKTTRKAAAKRPAKKAAAPALDQAQAAEQVDATETAQEPTPAKKAAAKKSTARKTAARRPAKKAASPDEGSADTTAGPADAVQTPAEAAVQTPAEAAVQTPAEAATGPAVLFQVPDAPAKAPAKRSGARKKAAAAKPADEPSPAETDDESAVTTTPDEDAETVGALSQDAALDEASTDEPGADEPGADDAEGGPTRRRRRRGGRRRRKPGDNAGADDSADGSAEDEVEGVGDSSDEASGEGQGQASDEQSGDEESTDDQTEPSSRRRRRRRRAGESGDGGEDGPNTVTRVRKPRSAEDQITSVSGSTRLEAKKQRRREGREAGRRRAPIVSEAEFLARREAVERVMVIRQRKDLTQIAVLEDKVLVEHYVARESQTSLIGNIYLGRVQNVLPSMEAAFIDIGKGRNAVLYAGEVNWSALGHKEGQPRKIESVLSSGQAVLVQVTKDPVGHKGARLTSQISLAGRFLVYVPDGTTSGISRKLPDTERNRLKTLLKEIVPDTAGVIVRTAAEGASEEELTRDVERLKARWEDVERKASNKGAHTQLLYGEPDLTLKVVRDLFTEDFTKLIIEGDDAWQTVSEYVESVAPDLAERLERFDRAPGDSSKADSFSVHRIEEQIHKGLDRKVWLPSGGSLVIDRTEAMTVVDVNTGKFTGSGGNLEETVTKNNLEAAEEIVRQLRLRDIGGIIVVDFIDMVLESNRDLVVRRLVECLGRDRTRHQVAEVTSLGLVQMTRKRIGTGLLESFSENCEHCHGRGVVIKDAPVEPSRPEDENRRGSRRRGRSKGDADKDVAEAGTSGSTPAAPSPKDVAAMARPDKVEAEKVEPEQLEVETAEPEQVETDQVQVDQVQVDQVEPAQAEAVEQVDAKGADTAESAPEPFEGPTPEPTPEPAQEEIVVAIAEPARPSVVTRTRRRSASRPAGPPASGDGEPSTEAPGDPTDSVEHVPIKKKGTRKR